MSQEQFDYSILALVISIITALAVMISALATIRIANASKKLGVALLMEGIERSTNDAINKQKMLSSSSVNLLDCDVYATALLNALDRLAFLKNQNNIGDGEIKFYCSWLGNALLLLEWKKDTFGKDFSESYSNLIKLCNDEGIKKDSTEEFPQIMLKLGKQFKKNREEREAKLKNNSSPEEKDQHDPENS